MIGLTHKRYSPICLDIGSRQVKAAQLEKRSGSWALSALSITRLTDSELENGSIDALRLKKVLRRQGFVGDRVLLLPDERMLSVVPLDLPRAAAEQQAGRVARLEYARTQQLAPDQFEMAWWPLPETARASDVQPSLAVGVRNEQIEQIVDDLQAVGLHPTRVDAGINAYMNLVHQHPLGGNAIEAVVDMGWLQTRICVLVDGVAVYSRQIDDLGLARLSAKLTQHNQLDPELVTYLFEAGGINEADNRVQLSGAVQTRINNYLTRVGEETRVSIEYARHRYPEHEIGTIFLVGGVSELPGCAERVSTGGDFQARQVSPGDLVRSIDAMKQQARWAAGTLCAVAALAEVA